MEIKTSRIIIVVAFAFAFIELRTLFAGDFNEAKQEESPILI